MNLQEFSTRQLIIDAGKKEFLSKGFQGASLRNIAKNAHVTTGALYAYFDGKEDLFSTIVSPCSAAVKCRFSLSTDSFFELPKDDESSFDCIDWMVDYIYDHYESFKILICCSDGTKFDSFINEMVEIEVESTLAHIKDSCDIDTHLCHMIVSGMFGGIFELIEHDMPRELAKPYVKKLREFNHAGWMELLNNNH